VGQLYFPPRSKLPSAAEVTVLERVESRQSHHRRFRLRRAEGLRRSPAAVRHEPNRVGTSERKEISRMSG
jgi:hypothetical protein